MPSAVGSILRSFQGGRTLNILTWSVHERYQSGLKDVDAVFWCIQGPKMKTWNEEYAPLPANHRLLTLDERGLAFPPDVEFDLVWSHNKWAHFDISLQLAHKLHLPLISLEHCLPSPNLSPEQIGMLKGKKGNLNVFISEMSRQAWGWAPEEALVIHHGVDTDFFSPDKTSRHNFALSVVNDWKNRDVWCGYNLWAETVGYRGGESPDIQSDIPVRVFGDTPGLSRVARPLPELVKAYRECGVFLNTSLISPVPTVLLEAMSCGVPCVSTPYCMVGDIIQHGQNGLLGRTPEELRKAVQFLLSHPNIARKMGENARRTIMERFSLTRFQADWTRLFQLASALPIFP